MKETLSRNKSGAALVIILGLLVILSGVVVAYLARTATDRQLARGSLSDVKANELARSALDLIVGDLRQEIADGNPLSSSNVIPQRSPVPASGMLPGIANLVRRSVRSDQIPKPAIKSRASAVNSTTDPSRNGRFITLARWNAHYLVPKAKTGDSGSDPITGGFPGPNYWAPDWVIVTRTGPEAFTAWNPSLADSNFFNSGYALGRYAYAIYDESGLLDMNVAGLPSPTPGVTDIGRKGNLALADLTGMKITPAGSTPSASSISKFVAWRNYATLEVTGTFPNLIPPSDPTRFLTYFLDPARDFRTVAPDLFLNRTDQAFVTRKELIELVGSLSASFNMLQFLGTFSRELNQPTWKPAGSTADLQQRFALNYLSLVKDNPEEKDKADIQKYFGLLWVDGTPGSLTPPSPAVPGHWQYVGNSGITLRSSIAAFITSADFFQLLNYAVYSTNSDDPDHIATTLGVGASIIDQYDGDSSADPLTGTTSTMIEYAGGWAVGMENVDPARPSPSPQPSPFPPPTGISPTPRPFVPNYAMLNRPFRNTGEIGYSFRAEATPAPLTVNFESENSADAPILDLFTYNTKPVRAGVVSLNTQNPAVIAAILKGATTDERAGITSITLAPANNAAASPTPGPMTVGVIGHPTLGTLAKPALSRAEIARLTAAAGSTIDSSNEEAREAVARALSEVTQTRTWGLLIDVVAQSGRYPPDAGSLADFIVEGQKRYWLHIAIDRISGDVIDQQLEAVND